VADATSGKPVLLDAAATARLSVFRD